MVYQFIVSFKPFLIVSSNEISSNLIVQKIDLANAYINMGKKGRAKSIIERIENDELSKVEKKEIKKLKKLLNG